MREPIPVTVLTGFLGAGKTTLLKHILQAEHGLRIAVIENEFSALDVDGELLEDAGAVQLMKVANGCVCCTGSKDLAYALTVLLERLDSGELDFERLVVECTGLADPGPVAQTFFTDELLRERYLLDGVLTLVDAVHASEQLSDPLLQAQIGFADRLLLTKLDLAEPAAVEALENRLQRINRRAPIRHVDHGRIDLAELLDIRGFNLHDEDLAPPTLFRPLRPVSEAVSLTERIQSIAIRESRPYDQDKIGKVMEMLLDTLGCDLLRYKGLLNIAGEERRLLFQGVQQIYAADWERDWTPDEERESRVVLIGMDLPEERIRAAFERAVARA